MAETEQKMKEQHGSIQIKRGKTWVLRWRETIREKGHEKRVMRFKVLGDVTAEHRRRKDRRTGRLRIPDEIRMLADSTLEPLKTTPVVSPLTTIGEFVTEYLEDRKPEPGKDSSGKLKPSTHTSYMKLWERYLRDRISAEVLRDFKRPDAYVLWKNLVTAYPHLSRHTMSHIRFFVSGVFEAAKNRGLFSGENPAAADLPSGLRGKAEAQAYTVDETMHILELLTRPQVQAIVALAWGSGLRKGEMAALRWTDYEPTETGAILHVRQSSWRGIISPPKTESSADDVKIGTEVCTFIDAYRVTIGNPLDGLMFCYSADRPINLDSLAYWHIKPILKKAGISWKGWHAFRRGNATHLAKQLAGNGTRAASIMLRHSDQGVTEQHYILNSKQDRRALKA